MFKKIGKLVACQESPNSADPDQTAFEEEQDALILLKKQSDYSLPCFLFLQAFYGFQLLTKLLSIKTRKVREVATINQKMHVRTHCVHI